MHDELEQHRREYFTRTRRIRRLLRPLPRRATVAKYPLLKWFAATARRSWFLWSFKRGPLLRAIYFGSVLSLLPLMGIQLPLSLLLCLGVRANLPVCAALQFLTNPLTAVPLYGLTYLVGHWVLHQLGGGEGAYDPAAALSLVQSGELLSAAGDVLAGLVVGGVVVGLAVGVVVDLGWRLLAWEARVFRERYQRLRERAAARSAARDPAGP
ncbi:MAG: DUF2062 domain-containing protein [Xanthomonadaceae bacterium]|jgi:hypothetical protein|nr:DUF2062 domain-containing protein [Xanthomonadaceae bacterium]